MNEEKNNEYWQGYIQKQSESLEICKMCKYREKGRKLEIEKGTLIEKLKKDKEKFSNSNSYTELKNYVLELLEILES